MDNHTIDKEKVKSEINKIYKPDAIGTVTQFRNGEITVSLYINNLTKIENRYNTDLGLNYSISNIYKDTSFDYVVNMRVTFNE